MILLWMMIILVWNFTKQNVILMVYGLIISTKDGIKFYQIDQGWSRIVQGWSRVDQLGLQDLIYGQLNQLFWHILSKWGQNLSIKMLRFKIKQMVWFVIYVIKHELLIDQKS